MLADDTNTNTPSWVPAAAVVALAVTAVSGFFYLRPLESQRPHDSSFVSAHPKFPLAHMWQDPLHVVHEHWNGVAAPEQAIPDIVRFARRIAECERPRSTTVRVGSEAGEPTPSVLRLLVMVPGTPYANDRETRRRQRHAVVSALTEGNFVPTNATRLHYFHAPRFEDVLPADGPGEPYTFRRHAGPLGVLPVAAAPPWPEPPAAPSERMLVGYEEFEASLEIDEPLWTSVQVLWLNADDFDVQLLHRISAIVAVLEAVGRCSRSTPFDAKTTNVLLGPADSGRLQAMLRADERESRLVARWFFSGILGSRLTGTGESGTATRWCAECELRRLTWLAEQSRKSLRILSTRATVPLDWLACSRGDLRCRNRYRINPAGDAGGKPMDQDGRADGPGTVRGEVARAVEKRVATKLGVESFHSVVVDDRLILRAIFQELGKRGACDKGPGRPRIAIVSEQDSVHGRVLDNLAVEVAGVLDDPSRAACAPAIIEYGYLRGVDGETHAADPPRTDDTENARRDEIPATTAAPSFRGHREQSFGVAQLDYVRRLSEQIATGNAGPPGSRDPRAGGLESDAVDGSSGTLVAIGVLGGDVYDKLLILQALRESRSEVVFFTTDLDARLLDPAVHDWTRNVIVGSSYGLTLESNNTITFRDSYQAALYAAVRQALMSGSRVQDEAREDAAPFEWTAQRPRLFEIGRDSVVELGRNDAAAASGREILLLISPLLILALYSLTMRGSVSEDAARTCRWWYGVVAAGAALAAAALYVFIRYHLLQVEPWPFLQGVSGVPQVAFQIMTVVFSLAVVALAHGRMRHAQMHMARELRQVTPPTGWQGLIQTLDGWRSTIRAVKGKSKTMEKFRHLVATLVDTVRKTRVSAWRSELAVAADELDRIDKTPTMSAAAVRSALWNQFTPYARWWSRSVRIGVGVVVGLSLREFYFSAIRDEQPLLAPATMVPGWLTLMLPYALFFAIFYCRDTLNVWRTFIKALVQYDVRRAGQSDAAAGRWTMDLLVRSTELIGPVVVFPLVLMVLLVSGRSTLFEGWNWTAPLVVFHMSVVGYILYAAVSFQMEAGRARETLRDRLRTRLGRANDPSKSKEIESVIEYIRTRRKGAFVPWTQHPILQTVALPLGSVVVLTAVENLLAR